MKTVRDNRNNFMDLKVIVITQSINWLTDATSKHVKTEGPTSSTGMIYDGSPLIFR